MSRSEGEDLLNNFKSLNVDLRNLSPNVIKAWFDTDCADTKELLKWFSSSLTNANYISPLEQAEYENIGNPLDSEKCAEEIAKLNPNYSSILDDSKHLEISLIDDEIELLEQENEKLDRLIEVYEKIDSNISSDLTYKTQKDIQLKVEAQQSQKACEDLCRDLDEVNKTLGQTLIKYDPEVHFVNFVNVEEYCATIENFNSFLAPFMEIDKTFLEMSNEQISDELETCKKRILHSYQIYLAYNVEKEKLKEILRFLNETDISESILSSNVSHKNTNSEAKELYKKKMCDALDGIASKFANYYLKQIQLHYVEQELEDYQQKSQNVLKILENITKCLSYYIITNYLQFEERRNVECISDFYQKMIRYVNEDLHRCRARTEQMTNIIEEYNSYVKQPAHERSKLISSIAKVLSSDDCTLKSTSNAVGAFMMELRQLESKVFREDLENEQGKMEEINENIKVLRNYLQSGPTNKVVLVALELQNAWLAIEEHLKKESGSIGQAVQIPHSARKAVTKSQTFTRQLWMNFLAKPSKLDSVLWQAEEDFKKRTQQYFE